MQLLTLTEAARFLRKSKSWLYQNRSIRRYRPPGSRSYLFDKDDLLAWVRSGGVSASATQAESSALSGIDIASPPVYHRNPLYR
ncbi:MAG: helix-turn-helix domain-containing protein [Nitrospirota bacterium]